MYHFTDHCGSFKSDCADKIKSLYLPLGNELLLSSISPDLHGDSKISQNSFLLAPVSRVDLSVSRASRNFWVYLTPDKIWSATGVSKDRKQLAQDKFTLEAGLLWQRARRENSSVGLSAEILSFVPSGDEAVEIMQVTLTNITKKTLSFISYAAIPLYARSADNLRDHRQVTSLLTRIKVEKFGLKVKPTLLFDESGHRVNERVYFAAGCTDKGEAPEYIYPTQEMFCGDGGDLEAPEAVLKNQLPTNSQIQGREPMGGLRFKKVTLSPGAKTIFIVALGIKKGDFNLNLLIKKYNQPEKINNYWQATKNKWEEQAKTITVSSGNNHFDNWLRWVNIQPVLRKIFGCSFLPDFDYGKGGRGWRDLWQDCLGLILSDPQSVRALLINNFSGVKIDGSNATIIGKNSGEFIADRNNISRVWMDHGVWPFLTLNLYLQETGDLDILLAPATYFRNHQINRAQNIDLAWSAAYGNKLKTKSGKIYRGTIFEHLLVQHLVQFFNVGAHNHIRLEGADWNDGLDMAKEHGESVAISALYADNLQMLAGLLKETGKKEIEIAAELELLLAEVDYAKVSAKHAILKKYFSQTQNNLSGKKIRYKVIILSRILEKRALWMKEHIRKTEWLSAGFFNGYYDNRQKQVEGKKGNLVRMTLTGQTFALMGGVATPEQAHKILTNVRRYLYDRALGGIHLNTNFKTEQHDLGRAFSFSYGDKENGAIFSHMVVMYAYALYKQGQVKAGWEALNSLYQMAANTTKSKIYPCLPEYFDLSGRGMYNYLTGSASWYMLTLLTQVFGVKGQSGDLLIEPKLSAVQFKVTDKVSVSRIFGGRKLKIIFSNPGRLDFGKYRIKGFLLNGENIPIVEDAKLVISREVILSLAQAKLHTLEVFLG